MLKAIVANFRSPSYPARAYAAASCEATEAIAETVESAAGTNAAAAAAGTTPSSHRLYHKAMHALEHLLLERGHQARRVLAEYAQRLVRTTPSASPPRLTLVGRSVGAQSAHTLNEQQQQQKQTRARSDRTDPTAPHRATLYTAFSGAYVAAALARALAAPCRLSKLS